MDGVIERRLLVNYRLDPVVARTLLPDGLRPQLVDGSAVAGVCLIRLGELRPSWLAPQIGWRMENAAHRIAVQWEDSTGVRAGVYVPERHSASWLPVAVGGRLFPGVHHRARIASQESESGIRVTMSAPRTHVTADIALTDEWSSTLFADLGEASDFFRAGDVGWSPARNGALLEGLRLETHAWRVSAGRPLHVASSFFDALPRGAATLDNVLVMRDVPVRWTSPPRSAHPRGLGAPDLASVGAR